jgi:hypothetical protein
MYALDQHNLLSTICWPLVTSIALAIAADLTLLTQQPLYPAY